MALGLVTLVLMDPAAVLAQDAMTGNAAAGEEHFNRQCIACHVVQNEANEVLAGRNARVGPNLYGVAGRPPGSYPEFNYSDLMEAYGATGVIWEEANFVPYVQGPTDYLREATGDDGRSKMTYQVRNEQEAYDLWAFLAAIAPADGAAIEDAAAYDATGAEGEAASGATE